MFTVYTLEDSRTHTVLTVGYTGDLQQTCIDVYACENMPDSTQEWITDLFESGYAPVIHILETGIAREERAIEIKKYWSAHYAYINKRNLPLVPVNDRLDRPGSSRPGYERDTTRNLRRAKTR